MFGPPSGPPKVSNPSQPSSARGGHRTVNSRFGRDAPPHPSPSAPPTGRRSVPFREASVPLAPVKYEDRFAATSAREQQRRELLSSMQRTSEAPRASTTRSPVQEPSTEPANPSIPVVPGTPVPRPVSTVLPASPVYAQQLPTIKVPTPSASLSGAGIVEHLEQFETAPTTPLPPAAVSVSPTPRSATSQSRRILYERSTTIEEFKPTATDSQSQHRAHSRTPSILRTPTREQQYFQSLEQVQAQV